MHSTNHPRSTSTERREALKLVWAQARTCRDCALHESRTTVVFGSGNADADLMFIGEAPGRNEDERGVPFVGQAGKLLDQLLSEIGLERRDVFVANTIKCRPPNNRDPYPNELQSCRKYLFRQIDLIQPMVIATLGNFATKLLRDDPTGITKVHGVPEERVIGPRRVRLYPLYHPAAALYTRSMVDVLREDFARLPELLKLGAPPQPEPVEPVIVKTTHPAAAPPDGLEQDRLEQDRLAQDRLAQDRLAQDRLAQDRLPDTGGKQLGLF